MCNVVTNEAVGSKISVVQRKAKGVDFPGGTVYSDSLFPVAPVALEAPKKRLFFFFFFLDMYFLDASIRLTHQTSATKM